MFHILFPVRVRSTFPQGTPALHPPCPLPEVSKERRQERRGRPGVRAGVGGLVAAAGSGQLRPACPCSSGPAPTRRGQGRGRNGGTKERLAGAQEAGRDHHAGPASGPGGPASSPDLPCPAPPPTPLAPERRGQPAARAASYPESTPSTRLSMKKEPMMMRGMKYSQFQALPAASLVWKQEERRRTGGQDRALAVALRKQPESPGGGPDEEARLRGGGPAVAPRTPPGLGLPKATAQRC